MKILLTNDDGIYAQGLWALYERFKEKHNVIVVAPDRERSAVGHGITLRKPLRISKVNVNGGYAGYAVNGTPADCVKLGIMEILNAMPDLVISGINPGANVGVNINYSGTVAAAREAALYGIPSFAVSINCYEAKHYNDAAIFAERLSEKIIELGLPPKTFLNVNIPEISINEAAGVVISKQGLLPLEESFEKRSDPRNGIYYWHMCDLSADVDDVGIDQFDLFKNYISITPIKCDTTDYSIIEELKKWQIDPEK